MPKTVEDELAGPTVFKDRSVLDNDWVPERLLHRDDELRQLSQLFRGVADGTTAQRALITGRIGTGKTALAKFFCKSLQEALRPKGMVVEYEWVNCRQNASEGLVLLKLLQHFDKNYPTRGYSTNEMLNDLRKQIDRRGIHFVALLDEADALLAKETDLVYSLTRFDDQRSVRKPTLSLLLASADPKLYSMLDEPTRSTVKETNVVALGSYPAAWLRDIVADRAARAFHKGAVDEKLLDLVADIAGREGNARYAIELLETAGQTADGKRSDRVLAEYVRAAKAETQPFASPAKLRLLSRQQQCALLAIARKLKRSKKPFLTTGEAEEQYKLVTEEFDEPTRAHTQFWKYLKELETADWIDLQRTETTGSGQTQHISLEDVTAADLAEALTKVLAGKTADD